MTLRHLLLAVLFSTVSAYAAHDVEPQTVVVRLRAGSPTATAWMDAGRKGPLGPLTSIIGDHSSEGYVSDATLKAYQWALDKRPQAIVTSNPGHTVARIAVIHYSVLLDPLTLARKLAAHPDVDYAEPLPIRRIDGMPNDPLAADQYHLGKIGAFDAWDMLPEGASALIGIVDTGVDTTHQDLGANVWKNAGEMGRDNNGFDKRSNGIDDDNNGFVDDWMGWDFLGADGQSPDNSPLPGNPHGTHVGGICAAIVDNHIGVAGVARNVRILAVKVGRDDVNSRTVGRTGDGILYAASMGASVINCSFGSSAQSFADIDVINAATGLGALIVAAAGNDGDDLAFYPAAYPNVLSVAATNTSDRKAFFSNFHATVDVSAPGQGILSTVLNQGYEAYDGTSMASPVVAAVAAMLRMVRPNFTPEEVLAVIKATTDDIDALNPLSIGRIGTGRVNAPRALQSSTARWASLTSTTFIEETPDDVFAPGEEITLRLTIKNILDPLTNATLTTLVIPSDVAPLVTSGPISVGPMQRGEERTLSEMVHLTLPDDTPMNGTLRLLVVLTDADGRTVMRELITATVNPSYRNLTENDIKTTVNSMGNIGFNDYPNNEQGIGLSYIDDRSLLFESGLLVGTSPTNLSNVVRGAATSFKDTSFHATRVVSIMRDSVPDGIRAVTGYDDRYDNYATGVSVSQHVYQSPADSIRNVITTVYDVTNRTDTVQSDVYLSLFFDWDIGTAGLENGCAWDFDNGIGLVQHANRPDLPSVGVSMISPNTVNFYAIDNDGNSTFNPGIYDNFIRAKKWLMMTSGIGRSNSLVTDVSMMIGAGPFALSPGQTHQVVFVIGVGSTYDDVVKGIRAARNRAVNMGLNATTFVRTPRADRIVHVENGPTLSPGTTQIIFELQSRTPVTIDIVDALGREIRTVYDQPSVQPGVHNESITIPDGASGNYFIRMRTFRGTTVSLYSLIR